MKLLNSPKEIYVSGFAYVLVAASLLLLPIRWTVSFLLCAAIHEASHILCALIMGVKIEKIQISAFGAKIFTQPMTGIQEFFCAMAGPAMGLLPILAHRLLPEAAVICVLLSAYNLLPIYPADGARMLRCALECFMPYKNAVWIAHILESSVSIGCWILCMYAAYRFKNLFLVPLAAVWLAVRIKMEIQLAKRGKKKYNIHIKTQGVQP